MIFHFTELDAPTIAIWLLIAIMCSWGLLLPSKYANDGGWSFLVPDHPISSQKAAGNPEAPLLYPLPIVFMLGVCAHYVVMIHSAEEEPLWPPITLSGPVVEEDHFCWVMMQTCQCYEAVWFQCFGESWENFSLVPWWAPNVLVEK